MKFDRCFSVDSIGNSGGLGLLWRDANSVKVLDWSRNHIDAKFNSHELDVCRVTGYYSMPEQSRRRASWDLL